MSHWFPYPAGRAVDIRQEINGNENAWNRALEEQLTRAARKRPRKPRTGPAGLRVMFRPIHVDAGGAVARELAAISAECRGDKECVQKRLAELTHKLRADSNAPNASG